MRNVQLSPHVACSLQAKKGAKANAQMNLVTVQAMDMAATLLTRTSVDVDLHEGRPAQSTAVSTQYKPRNTR